MRKYVLCTYFDHRYILQGLALISSIREHNGHDPIWVLCMTDECHRVLASLKLVGVELVRPSEVELAYPDLVTAKGNRSVLEYYFTMTPHLIQYVFSRAVEASTVVYLDADLFFFDDINNAFDLVGDSPVAIVPHNFSRGRQAQARHGQFNVGWVSFNRSEEGQRTLKWWSDRCAEWCYDYVDEENDRFADQRYLDMFPQLSPGACVIRHPGMNLAPWNIASYRIEVTDGKLRVNGQPLIFFHYHGLKKAYGIFYCNSHRQFRAPYSPLIRNAIYRPYVQRLVALARELASEHRLDGVDKLKRGVRAKVGFLGHIKRLLLSVVRLADILQGRSIVVLGPRVI